MQSNLIYPKLGFLTTDRQGTSLNGWFSMKSKYNFSVVPGLFAQDNPSTNDSDFNHITARQFGLLLESWAELTDKLAALRKECSSSCSTADGSRIKLMFLARHGQGTHNWAIVKYGQKEWDDHWSLLNGDGTVVWGPDAELTQLGKNQASDNNTAWKAQLDLGVPLPSRYFVSPFTRALDTMRLTWDSIGYSGDRPLVMEHLREDIGEHTCDMRRTRSYIQDRFGDLVEIDKSVTELDSLWTADHRETAAEHDARSLHFLNWLFDNVSDNTVSITSHSGTTNSILRLINHRPFELPPGGMIPVVVLAEPAKTTHTAAAPRDCSCNVC